MHLALLVVQSYAERHQSRPITPRTTQPEDNEELVVNELEGVWLDRAALGNNSPSMLLHRHETPPVVPRHRLLNSRPGSTTSTPIQQQQSASLRSTPMHATLSTPIQHGRISGSPLLHTASRNTIERQCGQMVMEKRVTGADDCPVCQMLLPQSENASIPGVC